jgi:hypothetical protein
MAPSKFQIYVDQSMRQPEQPVVNPLPQVQPHPLTQPQAVTLSKEGDWPKYIEENFAAKQQILYIDERRIYPPDGGEYSIEELNLKGWIRKQSVLALRRRCEELETKNKRLENDLEIALATINQLQVLLKSREEQQQPTQTLATQTLTQSPPSNNPSPPPNNRLSIVPQSLQPAPCDTSCYGQFNEAPSVVQDLWYHQTHKFTVPIDQSQYIREHCPTSTPSNKATTKKDRRMSRPSMGGSPTMKLSPITETSRDCNSKSSSSSSAMTTPGTTCKRALNLEPVEVEEPDRPLDPNDPTTYRKLLRALSEPLENRSSYVRVGDSMPAITNGVCFGGRGHRYLVDKEISKEAKIYTAQLLDNTDDSNSDLPVKTICFRVDQPSNRWLFYICDELHKRVVRQKASPDIELSLMNADPAIVYLDGSILVDEYFRCVPLEEYFIACSQTNKPFPKSVAAYLSLELIQIVRGIHNCDIVHMNLNPKNIIITGCPTRDDITRVDERTSIVKLIGFDHSIDARLLPEDFKFSNKLNYTNVDQVLESKQWLYEIDWISILHCIHKMFFLEDMEPIKDGDKWKVKKQFKGFPTGVWDSLFDGLLNINNDKSATNVLIERVVGELTSWIKANVSFVLREAVGLDTVLEDFCKSANRSLRLY